MIRQSEGLADLATALSAAQAEFTAIPKDSNNPFFKSKYAGLPEVVKAASPILTKHGLSISQFLGTDESGDTLTTFLLHKSGQFLSESMRLYSQPGKGQSAAQGQGSAATYARRYSYMAALGLVADEDNDGNGPPPAAKSNGTQLATPKDVEEMVTAAKGLEREQIKLALAACGIADAPTYNKIPAEKVAPLVKTLAAMERA